MRCLILFLFFTNVFCSQSKQKYCQVIAHLKLYPEVDIARFCNSYVTVVEGNFCCIQENNRDDVLRQTCLPISQFSSGTESVGTLKPQTFRTKPTTDKPFSTIRFSTLHISQASTMATTRHQSKSTLAASQKRFTTSTTMVTTRHQSMTTWATSQKPFTTSATTSVFTPVLLDEESFTTFNEETTETYNPRLPEDPEITSSNSETMEFDVKEFTDDWIQRFRRSMQQMSSETKDQEMFVSLFRESMLLFIDEYKRTYSSPICPQSNSLIENDPFVKTPFDFTFQNIWNALFGTGEWNDKFTFPNFLIDQQTGIFVTSIATLITLFCDKQTRDRLAALTDDLNNITCFEKFCCPSLFYLLRMILQRAQNPPPRKIIKKKFKHLPKTPMEHVSCEDPNTVKRNLKNPHNKTKQKKSNKIKRARVFFSKQNQPETHIEIEEHQPNNNHISETILDPPELSTLPQHILTPRQNTQSDYERIETIANVHHNES